MLTHLLSFISTDQSLVGFKVHLISWLNIGQVITIQKDIWEYIKIMFLKSRIVIIRALPLFTKFLRLENIDSACLLSFSNNSSVLKAYFHSDLSSNFL